MRYISVRSLSSKSSYFCVIDLWERERRERDREEETERQREEEEEKRREAEKERGISLAYLLSKYMATGGTGSGQG